MLQQLYGEVYCWTERHGKPETTYYWNSYAIRIDSANTLALVDPLPMSDEVMQNVEEVGTPTHILLTCNWHLRESEMFRQKWGCKIYINELGLEEAETSMDGTFKHGDSLWGVVEMIHLPDVNWQEETAFLVHQEQGLLIIGDAVAGGRADLGIVDGEVGVHPPTRITDLQKEKPRKTLDNLMKYPFDTMCFGHGSPILHKAKAVLRQFIDTA
ncbi:MAG: MBL fold metallo-hydrolase [Candidatus Poribacteria bacterium]|nr:MBL fold metallo-hydrolase [Candidatus Poribacteria bacterium]